MFCLRRAREYFRVDMSTHVPVETQISATHTAASSVRVRVCVCECARGRMTAGYFQLTEHFTTVLLTAS